MIMSGRSQESLSKWFKSVPGIGLAAEHGYKWMHPVLTRGSWRNLLVSSRAVTGMESIGEGSSGDESGTTSAPPPLSEVTSPASNWLIITGEIMNRYVNRTPNTYIEDKGSARVWQFRDAEADFGIGQAKELHAELEVALRNEPVDITTGKGYVEVKIHGVNKGASVERILETLRIEHQVVPDFIFSIGDDRSDENMFEKLLELSSVPKSSVFTCTVGRKKTVAKYFVSDVDSVSSLLSSLTGGTGQTAHPNTRSIFTSNLGSSSAFDPPTDHGTSNQ
jgi:trehalose 6-phosphate synthase/phosphatase